MKKDADKKTAQRKAGNRASRIQSWKAPHAGGQWAASHIGKLVQRQFFCYAQYTSVGANGTDAAAGIMDEKHLFAKKTNAALDFARRGDGRPLHAV